LVMMNLWVVAVCLTLLRQDNSVDANGVYSCPTGCRCTIMKWQRDRTTLAASGQSLAPGRKVVCRSTSPVIASMSQILLDNLPKDTLHLYVHICFDFI